MQAWPIPNHVSQSSNLDAWRQEILNSFRSIDDLLKNQIITHDEAIRLRLLGDRFKVRITPYYAGIMNGSDSNCPIRRQSIPDLAENDPILPHWAMQISHDVYQRSTPWDSDAIGDVKNLAAPRITHRYSNRVIVHLSSMCAVYCRFCFRKSHLNDEAKTLYEGTLEPAFHYLENHPEVDELILTGGDPLSTTDAALKNLFARISNLKHIRTVRIHSRMAVTLPSRFTTETLKTFDQDWNFQIVLSNHFNHPKELTPQAKQALKDLKKTGVTLINQSVLLRDVNASVECLKTLFQELYHTGVIPFYLHHPDWTPGTFHFRTSIEEGQKLYSKLKGQISGPALPHYVLDIPQGFGKANLMDPSLVKLKDLPEGISDLDSSPLRGALYEISAPVTKHSQHPGALASQKYRYLDIFKI
jgi:lysine 2,3-aminomutase